MNYLQADLDTFSLQELPVLLIVKEHTENGTIQAETNLPNVAAAKRIARSMAGNNSGEYPFEMFIYYENVVAGKTHELVFTSDTPKWVEM